MYTTVSTACGLDRDYTMMVPCSSLLCYLLSVGRYKGRQIYGKDSRNNEHPSSRIPNPKEFKTLWPLWGPTEKMPGTQEDQEDPLFRTLPS